MKPIGALGTLLFACALLASCVHVGTQEHALTGKVWDVTAQRFVDPSAVVEHAAAVRFVLLGEIHDNAEHHRIQARILEELLKRGRRPALVS